MNAVRIALSTALMGVSLLYGADAITGRVVNSSSSGLASARIWLKNSPSVADSTGSDGTFSLTLPNTAARTHRANAERTLSYDLQNNQLKLTVPSTQSVSVTVFNSIGKRVATLFEGTQPAGMQTITLNRHVLPVASGCYILQCATTTFTSESILHVTGSAYSTTTATSTNHGSSTQTAKTAAGDTLIVLCMGHEIEKMPLSEVTANDVGDIKLSLRGYSIKETTAVKSRTIEVVIPSDYDELYELPVLYLIHGGSEDHTAWRIKGQLISALNGTNFPERDKMQPMIIVTPDAQSSAYGNYGRGADPFYTDLTVDIRGYIEKNYKVDTSRYARAVSGFSMGAMQTHNLTLFYPELFGYACPISGGLNLSDGFSETKFKSDISSGTIDTALVNSMKIYRLHSNPTDMAYTNGDTPNFEKLLGNVGIKHTYNFTSYQDGGHTFSFCNGVFKNYSPMLFKN